MKTLYFHGLPGSKAELGLTRLPHLTTPDRNHPSFAQLANSLPAGELHLVGFSLGAAAALRIATLLPERVVRVTLAAPIAPLGLGNFAGQMTSASPVHSAITGQTGLSGKLRAGLARLAPGSLVKQAVATATGREATFFSEPAHRKTLGQALQEGQTTNKLAYDMETAAFRQPWECILPEVRCQVSIFHGTDDQIAPRKMASALARAIRYAEVSWLDGRGHYTTLVDTMDALARLPEIR